MGEIRSKKQLEIILSKLKGFENAKVSNEQYITPSNLAAEVLWKAHFKDIVGKVIVDLGCGTGILGIGCLLLGAKKVIFVEKDEAVMGICNDNIKKIESEGYELGEMEFVVGDVRKFAVKVDTVVTNPPFGTKKRHADKEFLLRAFSIADVTYSFHKTSTKEYIMQLASGNGFNIKERFDFEFMLRNTMKHHMKRKEYIQVSCFVFEKKD